MATRNFIPLTNIGIDNKQEKRLNFLFGLIAALSGIAAIMIYVDNRRHSKVQEEILDLDKELKMLQIREIKNGNS